VRFSGGTIKLMKAINVIYSPFLLKMGMLEVLQEARNIVPRARGLLSSYLAE
jgi:hypothetical protein